MKNIAILFFVTIMVSCSSNAPQAEVSPGLTKDQLAPTLKKIAETGKYDTVLEDLTIGLENAGHMEEAVSVQNFPELSDPEDVKKLASKLADSLSK
ncbi:hypothetical protein [Gimesia aquarii]|uniref:Uncharacterized protein n=1 Tax=Gimesia aquarii TaxID=2527964 RepID=A0A517WN58_9PLAN|nr:hypothetical protein [Gimesia aquarii]QDU06702.1 hypothetical protein V202x_00450 [Gimesia aquarii]